MREFRAGEELQAVCYADAQLTDEHKRTHAHKTLEGSFLSLGYPFSTAAAKTMTKVMDIWMTVRGKEQTWERTVQQRERWTDDKIPILVCVFLYMSCEGEKLLLAAWRYMLIFSNRKGFTTRGCDLCCAFYASMCICVW